MYGIRCSWTEEGRQFKQSLIPICPLHILLSTACGIAFFHKPVHHLTPITFSHQHKSTTTSMWCGVTTSPLTLNLYVCCFARTLYAEAGRQHKEPAAPHPQPAVSSVLKTETPSYRSRLMASRARAGVYAHVFWARMCTYVSACQYVSCEWVSECSPKRDTCFQYALQHRFSRTLSLKASILKSGSRFRSTLVESSCYLSHTFL